MAQATRPVATPFPPELEARTRDVAISHNISRAELVRRAMIDYLRQLEVQPTPTVLTKESGYECQPI